MGMIVFGCCDSCHREMAPSAGRWAEVNERWTSPRSHGVSPVCRLFCTPECEQQHRDQYEVKAEGGQS